MLILGFITIASAFLFLAAAIMLIGFIISLVGAIQLIIAAFRWSLPWGLAYLFIPFAKIVFWIRHWPESRDGLILYFKGLGVILVSSIGFFAVSYFVAPDQAQGRFLEGFSKSFHKPPPKPEPAISQPLQTAREDVSNAQKQTTALETQANQLYVQLTDQRKSLDTKDAAAVHAFNLEAANYATVKTRLAEQTKDLARLKKQEELLEAQATEAAGKSENNVVMYSTSWCPACKTAKQYFTQRNIPFQEIDVEHSPEGAAEFRRLGGGGVPMIVIKGDKMTGFSPAWVEQHLNH